jgi:hypothetical protein
VPDLLVRGPKGWALLEVKSPGGRLTPAQRQWRQTYGVVPIVQSPDEAIRAVLGG